MNRAYRTLPCFKVDFRKRGGPNQKFGNPPPSADFRFRAGLFGPYLAMMTSHFSAFSPCADTNTKLPVHMRSGPPSASVPPSERVFCAHDTSPRTGDARWRGWWRRRLRFGLGFGSAKMRTLNAPLRPSGGLPLLYSQCVE